MEQNSPGRLSLALTLSSIGLPPSIAQVVCDPAFPGSKIRVFSRGNGKQVAQHTSP